MKRNKKVYPIQENKQTYKQNMRENVTEEVQILDLVGIGRLYKDFLKIKKTTFK